MEGWGIWRKRRDGIDGVIWGRRERWKELVNALRGLLATLGRVGGRARRRARAVGIRGMMVTG